jgi:SRSO17 transposase
MDGSPTEGWEDELERWLAPFLERLRRQAQRRWAPLYLKGLLLPGERKSVEPLAARVAPADTQQLHHFVSASPWATAPLEEELAKAADRLVGGPGAVLVVDDPALVEQGRRSVGVKRQYCGQLGKRANCQALVSLTLARAEVPVCVGLRLFLPEDWCADAGRRATVSVPEAIGYLPKWRMALDGIDRVLAAGARFGCVLADGEYGKAAEFRAGLAERQLSFAVGVLPAQKVYPADVTLSSPARKPTGRPRKHPVPSAASVTVAELLEARPEAFRAVSWRAGTKGPLKAAFAAFRVRVADGPAMARAQHLPGEGCERSSQRARRRASRHGGAEVPSREPPGRHADRGSRGADQGPLGVRAGPPAAQGRAGPGSLRGPLLARAAPPRPLVPARLRLPAAPAAPGGKASPRAGEPGRRPGRACPSCVGASPPPCVASCSAALTAGSASPTTSGSERGRVVLETVEDLEAEGFGDRWIQDVQSDEEEDEEGADETGGEVEAVAVIEGCRSVGRPPAGGPG